MATTHREMETSYIVPRDHHSPDLSSIPKVHRVGDAHESHLQATYFDTPTAALARHRITLRRRTGSADEGWHLKTPQSASGSTDRLERRVALDQETNADAVPKELVQAIRAYVRDEPLSPVATIETQRVERSLYGADDELALVADDLVHSEHRTNGDVDRRVWREFEVELVHSSRKFLTACRAVFRDAGLEPSPFASKLHHALGEGTAPVRTRPQLDGTVGALARRHITEQVDELLARDREAREDESDGVHKMRVATRRLRSALATYRPLFDRDRTDPIRDELKWLGGLLGTPRDLEVLRARIVSHAHQLPPELLIGPVILRVEVDLGNQHQDGYEKLVDALESPRYFRLLDALEALVDDPPFSARASRSASKEAKRVVRHASRKVRKAAKRVDQAESDQARSEALHEVRKKAKRARYAAESAEPVLGKKGGRLASRMEDLQELLGEVQDSVASRKVLRELGMTAHLDSENAFTFGLLYKGEETAASSALQSYNNTLRRALSSTP
jgi:CHAD domain-containing protein